MIMGTKYDPSVIQQLADKLYRSAAFVVIAWLAIGAGLGVVAGQVYLSRHFSGGGQSNGGAIIGGLIGSVIGYLFGQWRAFYIRVMAQTALCQKQIEENTRPRPTAVAVRRPQA